MARSRFDDFLEEVGEALRADVQVQEAVARLRAELDVAFERFALSHAERQARRERLARLTMPQHLLARLDDDVRVAAAWLAPFEGRLLRSREEAFAVLQGLLEVLRANTGAVTRDGARAAEQVVGDGVLPS